MRLLCPLHAVAACPPPHVIPHPCSGLASPVPAQPTPLLLPAYSVLLATPQPGCWPQASCSFHPCCSYNITTTHSMFAEVDFYRQHHWRCERCGNVIKRSMNRPPQEADCRQVFTPWPDARQAPLCLHTCAVSKSVAGASCPASSASTCTTRAGCALSTIAPSPLLPALGHPRLLRSMPPICVCEPRCSNSAGQVSRQAILPPPHLLVPQAACQGPRLRRPRMPVSPAHTPLRRAVGED